MKIRKSSLSRHLQKCDWYCKTNEIPPETEIDKSGQQQAQLNETPQESIDKISEQHDNTIQDDNTTCVKIQIEIRVIKNDDGTTVYNQDPIEINGVPMILVPVSSVETIQLSENASTNGKFNWFE